MELREFINVMRSRRWIIIQATLIVALTAVVVSYLQPKTYEGTADVLISERDTAAALAGAVLSDVSSQPERGLQTQVQLMKIRPLAEATIKKLDPQFMKHIADTDALVYADGALPRCIKLLIAMAFDAAHGAPGGVRALAEQALKCGATKEQVAEALRVPLVPGPRMNCGGKSRPYRQSRRRTQIAPSASAAVQQ